MYIFGVEIVYLTSTVGNILTRLTSFTLSTSFDLFCTLMYFKMHYQHLQYKQSIKHIWLKALMSFCEALLKLNLTCRSLGTLAKAL